MKKVFVIALVSIILAGCRNNPKEHIRELSGYWEIQKVQLPDGSVKEYTVNTNIDYFELLNDSVGYRKKMQPTLTGNFYTTDDTENFKLTSDAENGLQIHYKTLLDKWTETIIKLNEKELVVVNAAGITYYYQRFEKINITP
ncbi:hypothetical protein [Ascidiimonas aurantiaca]|uniref:hypothetical protein n=1 Tax=Ascidiimonas aurantiaca TaxID=1685432 RepID=UPI0030EBB473